MDTDAVTSRAGGSPATVAGEPARDRLLRAVRIVLAVWLLASPLVLEGPSLLVGAKDVVVGTLLLAVSVTATLRPRVRRWEGAASLAAGAALVTAAVLLQFGSGSAAVARQWNEVVVGVLLICLWSARGR